MLLCVKSGFVRTEMTDGLAATPFAILRDGGPPSYRRSWAESRWWRGSVEDMDGGVEDIPTVRIPLCAIHTEPALCRHPGDGISTRRFASVDAARLPVTGGSCRGNAIGE
jgi:hypothetical protein